MLCEKCKRNEATVHLTEIIKNVKSEVHLCEACARGIGLNSKLSNFSLTVPDMLTFLDVEEVRDIIDVNACKTCGGSFLDYKKAGRLGCPDCYRYLWSALEPVIKNYHGEKKHIGKMPINYAEMKAPGKLFLDTNVRVIEKTHTATELERKLAEAVREERYEEAAFLRDMLKKQGRGG